MSSRYTILPPDVRARPCLRVLWKCCSDSRGLKHEGALASGPFYARRYKEIAKWSSMNLDPETASIDSHLPLCLYIVFEKAGQARLGALNNVTYILWSGMIDSSFQAWCCWKVVVLQGSALWYGVVLCTKLFESSSKEGRARNWMGSGNRMDSAQQVTACPVGTFIFLVYMSVTFSMFHHHLVW